MQRKIISDGQTTLCVLSEKNGCCLVVDCQKKSMPIWIPSQMITSFSESEWPLEQLDMTKKEQRVSNKRFSIISEILDTISDKHERAQRIAEASLRYGVSEQTVRQYLWSYLVYQDKQALTPKRKRRRVLTQDEKNFRWGLNKFYYTTDKRSLAAAYRMMVRARYTDMNGQVVSNVPGYNRFYRFYKRTRKTDNLIISRQGKTEYQRNHRPLIGGTVQDYVRTIGVGMADSTVCDIYLVNDAGKVIGRPLMAACIDAYSTLCLGFTLGWEGGTDSLEKLVINIVSDKNELYRRWGTDIPSTIWPSGLLPGRIITDRGTEYLSERFSQITELGITLENLDAYRPDMKSIVERFFGSVQESIEPYLTRNGWVRPDFQQRGAPNYRRAANLTLPEFERIMVQAVIYYNSCRIMKDYPFTEEMLFAHIRPYAAEIWNWAIQNQAGANLISVSAEQLRLTLMPRTMARFSREGLVVNRLHYTNPDYKEAYLSDRSIHTVAFDPDDVSVVYLITSDNHYDPFVLKESRFLGKTTDAVSLLKEQQHQMIRQEQHRELQARIDLEKSIQNVLGEKKR